MKKNLTYKEEELYRPLLENVNNYFKKQFENYHLEITSRGIFSEKIKEQIPRINQLLFSFINKRNSPDITGYITIFEPIKRLDDKAFGFTHNEFITIEIKRNKIKLNDVCQARKYGLLFQAKYAFLLTPKPIPTEIKRLAETTNLLSIENKDELLNFKSGVRIAQFSINKNVGEINCHIQDETWFPDNPFDIKKVLSSP